jgi:hypothetical protein
MRREKFNFFAALFSPKSSQGKAGTATDTAAEVMITASAQPHVLRAKMKEAKLTHGETVMATISPVRLQVAMGRTLMYFCPMQSIEVLKTLSAGDGGDIPSEVEVSGLTTPPDLEPGLYTLKNVKLSSNGVMQVHATASTAWELAPAPVAID